MAELENRVGPFAFVEPGLAVAHAGRRLANGGSLFRHALHGLLQALLLRPVLIIFKLLPVTLPPALLHKGVVAAGKIGNLSVLQVPDPSAQETQKGTVVGDQDQRAREGPELLPQQREAFFIQVRGGLVREEKLRTGGKGGGDPAARHFPAGEPVAAGTDTEKSLHLIIRFAVFLPLLADKSERTRTAHRAFIRFRFPGKKAQQGGFPGAVFADEAYFFTVIY